MDSITYEAKLQESIAAYKDRLDEWAKDRHGVKYIPLPPKAPTKLYDIGTPFCILLSAFGLVDMKLCRCASSQEQKGRHDHEDRHQEKGDVEQEALVRSRPGLGPISLDVFFFPLPGCNDFCHLHVMRTTSTTMISVKKTRPSL